MQVGTDAKVVQDNLFVDAIGTSPDTVVVVAPMAS